jgi:hypothetical protein
VSAYLDFAELQALNRRVMTMSDWIAKLDDFLKLSERDILTHAGQVSHEQALQKAEADFEKYRKLTAGEPSQVEKDFDEAVEKVKKLPEKIMSELFEVSGKTKGPIRVRGKLNGKDFIQTVVRYQAAWRLYLNAQMRLDAGIDVGDEARVRLEFDPTPRDVPMHRQLGRALSKNRDAKSAFAKLTPSRQTEILRYLNSLKSAEAVARNVEKVVRQLLKKSNHG